MTRNTPNNISQEENDSWKDQNMWVEGWSHLSARSHVYSLLTPHRVAQRWMILTCFNSPEAEFILVLEPRMEQNQRGMHPWIRGRGPLRTAMAYATATKASSGNKITVEVGDELAATPCTCASVQTIHQEWHFPPPGVILRDDYTSFHRSTNAKITAASCSGLKWTGIPSESSLPMTVTTQLNLAVIRRSLTILNLTLFFWGKEDREHFNWLME